MWTCYIAKNNAKKKKKKKKDKTHRKDEQYRRIFVWVNQEKDTTKIQSTLVFSSIDQAEFECCAFQWNKERSPW